MFGNKKLIKLLLLLFPKDSSFGNGSAVDANSIRYGSIRAAHVLRHISNNGNLCNMVNVNPKSPNDNGNIKTITRVVTSKNAIDYERVIFLEFKSLLDFFCSTLLG